MREARRAPGVRQHASAPLAVLRVAQDRRRYSTRCAPMRDAKKRGFRRRVPDDLHVSEVGSFATTSTCATKTGACCAASSASTSSGVRGRSESGAVRSAAMAGCSASSRRALLMPSWSHTCRRVASAARGSKRTPLRASRTRTGRSSWGYRTRVSSRGRENLITVMAPGLRCRQGVHRLARPSLHASPPRGDDPVRGGARQPRDALRRGERRRARRRAASVRLVALPCKPPRPPTPRPRLRRTPPTPPSRVEKVARIAYAPIYANKVYQLPEEVGQGRIPGTDGFSGVLALRYGKADPDGQSGRGRYVGLGLWEFRGVPNLGFVLGTQATFANGPLQGRR